MHKFSLALILMFVTLSAYAYGPSIIIHGINEDDGVVIVDDVAGGTVVIVDHPEHGLWLIFHREDFSPEVNEFGPSVIIHGIAFGPLTATGEFVFGPMLETSGGVPEEGENNYGPSIIIHG